VSNLRDRTVRAVKAESVSVASSPTYDLHRQVVVSLHVALLTSAHDERAMAEEFWRCYRHLLEGGAVDDIPLKLISRKTFLNQLQKTVQEGQSIFNDPTFTRELHDNDD
jgi:hypothetical protein